jgi:hypothetical protein
MRERSSHNLNFVAPLYVHRRTGLLFASTHLAALQPGDHLEEVR